VVRWRLKDLALWIWEEFRISLDETTLGRELLSGAPFQASSEESLAQPENRNRKTI